MQKILSERIGLASLFLLGLFSLVGWYAFFHQSLSGYASETLSILLGFSLACVFFFLGTMVWEERWEILLGAALPFVPALFFVQSFVVLAAVPIAFLSAWFAVRLIHTEKEERIHFQYFKTAQAGQFFFIAALALVIASSYFTQLSRASWEELVSRYHIGEGAATVILKAASYFQPELGHLKGSETSVREYLIRLAQEKVAERRPDGEAPAEEAPKTKSFAFELDLAPGLESELAGEGYSLADVLSGGAAEERYIVLGTARLSELSGNPVSENDPIDLVFAAVLRHELVTAFSGPEGVPTLSEAALPLVLSVLLFLALLPVGTLLAYPWLGLGYLIFLFLLRTDQLEIVTHRELVEELQFSDER